MKTWVVACSLALVAAAGFSQSTSPVPGPSDVANACAARASQGDLFAALQGARPLSTCSATASCAPHTNVSCLGNSTCTAVDRDCPQKGYVTCDGVTTYCPVCTIEDNCYECSASGGADCFSCCRCNGGTIIVCAQSCGG
jgi:hypothetical protein